MSLFDGCVLIRGLQFSHLGLGSLQMTQQMVPANDLGIEAAAMTSQGCQGGRIPGVRRLGVSIWACFRCLLLLEKSLQRYQKK